MAIPLISCMMPTYGRPAYVNQSVAMFLEQDYPQKELILWNDCPGQTFVSNLPGVRVINTEERFDTLGEKRNAIIEEARGEWIAVWDDDDVYMPWRLSFSLKRAVERQTCLYCPAEYWAYWGEESLHDNHARMEWISHPAILFHKDVWKDAEGYPAQTLGEDAVFIRKILENRGLAWSVDEVSRIDRFMILRGKSNYHHTSIGGGSSPPDIAPGRFVIEPRPIDDPRLRETRDRLIQIRRTTREASEQVGTGLTSVRSAAVVYVDDLSPRQSSVGYGELGLHGALGYENKRVEVGGRSFEHALSGHAPSRLIYSLGKRFETFRTGVAINDDVVPRETCADFMVYADGRLVGSAVRVTQDSGCRVITADVHGAQELELVIRHRRWDFCHTVWIEPVLEPATGNQERTVVDCLRRAEMPWRTDQPCVDLCLATVASAGYEDWLDDLLGSIRANACCPEALLAVFLIDDSQACRSVAESHRAVIVPCRPLCPTNMASKAVLYSAGCVLNASKFVCLDADMIVLGDLRPIVASLDALPTGSILTCRDAQWSPNLGEAFESIYGGTPDESHLLGGLPSSTSGYGLIVNDGIFAGTRASLCELDETIRGIPGAIKWLDSRRHDVPWRNQYLFNLALARTHCGVELDSQYNVQLNRKTIQVQNSDDGVTVQALGRKVSIVHFNGGGRSKHQELRGRFRKTMSQTRIGAAGD